MVKELVVYPDERIYVGCTDVREFDDKLSQLLNDMRETIDAKNLNSLSAIEIAHPFNIIVIKDKDSYLEFINPRILKADGEFISKESSNYYPDVTVDIKRYEKIKLYYEDREGKAHYKDIDDKNFSALLQQKIDHLFGGTILDKVDKQKREEILQKLKDNGYYEDSVGDVCPTFSRKDYFVSFTDKVLFFMALGLFSPLFIKSSETLSKIYSFEKYALPVIILLMIGFVIYAWFESKKYRQCSSCQIGNNIGVAFKRVGLAILFATIATFIF